MEGGRGSEEGRGEGGGGKEGKEEGDDGDGDGRDTGEGKGGERYININTLHWTIPPVADN